MESTSQKIIYDTEQRYSCATCNDVCCKYFSVKVNSELKEQLEKLPYVKERMLQENEYFESSPDGEFYLPVIFKEDHCECLFYDAQEHCIIHNRTGYDHKPITCQMFPFSIYLDAEDNVHIEVTYGCRNILKNIGEPLDKIKNFIVTKYVSLDRYPETYPLYGSNLTQKQVFYLAEKLKDILNDTTLSLDDTLYNYHLFLKNFKQSFKILCDFDKALEISLKRTNEPMPGIKNNASNKSIFSAYLTILLLFTTYNRKNPLFKQSPVFVKSYIDLYFSLLFLKKNCILPLSPDRVNLQNLKNIKPAIDNESDHLIRRYLRASLIRSKLIHRRNINLLFFDNIVYYYSMIKILSQLIALIELKDQVEYDHVETAIRKMEPVVYHTNVDILFNNKFNKIINDLFSEKMEKTITVINFINPFYSKK